MGLGVRAAPFTYVAHALAVAAAAMVLVWCVHFRGGLALEATNKNLIFNVHSVLMLIGYIILGSEAIMVYKSAFLAWNRNNFSIWYSVDIWISRLLLPWGCTRCEEGALPWHILLGIFVYILALATAELGFLEKLTFLQSSGLDKYGPEAFLVNFTALFVVLFGASFVVAAVTPARLEEPQGYAPIPEN
ncbi:unnamed protein product [Alopecurus aequalis]